MSIRVQDFNQVQVAARKLNNSNNEQIHSKKEDSADLQKQIISFQGAQALKAIALSPAFKGTTSVNSNYEMQKDQIVFTNILKGSENFSLPENKTLNPQGLRLENEFSTDNVQKTVRIKNKGDKEVFRAQVKTDRIDNAPEIQAMTGKFNPSAEIIDKENGIKIIMLGGSEITGKDFNYVLQGELKLHGQSENNKLTFQGKSQVAISTFNMEPRTVAAVDKFNEDKVYDEAIRGDHHELVEKHSPTIVIPAGGFGTRFLNISGTDENKPSSVYPTRDSYRIIGNALGLAASAGALDEDSKVKYISQAGEIKGHNVIRANERLDENGKLRNIEDGGAIAESVAKGHLSDKKDMIILNADIFTTADITRPYHSLKTLPDAALVIPYYPVAKERASAFGLMSVQKDAQDNYMMSQFLEKPKTEEDFKKAEGARIEGTNNYMANPGMYFFSPEVVKQLKEKGKNIEAVGLGASFVPEIVEMCNKGELLTKDGKPMKVYTVPLESKGGKPAIWDDVGSAEAYVSRIHDVAHEVSKYGVGHENKYYGIPGFVLHDFEKSVDLKTGVICGQNEKESFENFKHKYGIKDDGIKGNVMIMPLDTK